MKKVLFITLLSLFILSGCSTHEQIDIKSPSYMYSENSEIGRNVRVSLNGTLNKKDDVFEGELSIDDIVFKKVIFTHNTLLISYEGSKRTVLGDIYFDKQANQYAIIVTEPELYTKLTHAKFQNKGLVISSPASSLAEAKIIEAKLKAME
ncbi:hypothetical protein HUB98_11480 [Paenibacillus barcinonensis]|uniref:Uncharacterized protein n=1 Tax=Paenibacillus barcinonensis TaxID=198119 RepID=A0A2V4WAJ0_PAEBA|nr:hypothetical protein [Paenibacillus barcinonensis]PYE48267.1 hypothetical protein DFQ00_109121 [Paenibacillus barcinonensis]QKS56886.1 hypothetical protein HUB98_11480 [Paenibacillus barcinonensis]